MNEIGMIKIKNQNFSIAMVGNKVAKLWSNQVEISTKGQPNPLMNKSIFSKRERNRKIAGTAAIDKLNNIENNIKAEYAINLGFIIYTTCL
jgi:hypothetical protein